MGARRPQPEDSDAGAPEPETRNITRTESLIRDPDAVPQEIREAPAVDVGLGIEVGGYRLLRKLGAGGMGAVYEAEKLATRERVALKYSHGSGAQNLLRFKREFRSLADVHHENLVALGELVVLPDERMFFTMELLEGSTLMRYLRGSRGERELPNLVRVRRAIRQLVAAVSALHDAGWLHRDVKPSNVIVTHQGRLVLLDFGLVRDADAGSVDLTKEGEVLGTPAYMAPEQAAGRRSTPATDFYAIGTILFEALTGRRPFEGSLLHVLRAKREEDAPSPEIHVEGIPAPLLEICRGLLRRDPEARPGAAEILAALGGDYRPYLEQITTGVTRRHDLLLGRDAQLERLRAAHQALCRSRTGSMIHLHGKSGFGKSSLVRAFLADVDDARESLVLRGRCLERESVPYKGLDAAVDALANELAQLPAVEAAAVLPRHVSALSQVFPVFDSVPVVAQAPSLHLKVDGRELRSMAFAALRELLLRLSDRRPVLLCVDDFQWADLESSELIADLLRPPDPPAMLLLISYRDDEHSLASPALAHLRAEQVRTGTELLDLEVGPLADEDAARLATALYGESVTLAPETLTEWVAAAAGSPFYLQELVRGSDRTLSPTALDQLVIQRVLELPASTRRMLEIFAVAGGPLEVDAAAEILDADSSVDDIQRLRHEQLLREAEESGGHLLEPEHDRIREVVVGELHPDRLANLHRSVAETLENRGGDAETLAEHFERGGLLERAAVYAAKAATSAALMLAFDRAVTLAERAIRLRAANPDDPELEPLRNLLADNLIGAGRGREASVILLDLASRRHGDEIMPLRMRAADCLIKAGDVRGGLAVLQELFESVGMRLPAGRMGALKAFLVEKALSILQRSPAPDSHAMPVDPLAGTRADLCFAALCGLSTQEVMLGTFLEARHLREALKSGDRYRMARALAIHSTLEVQMGKPWTAASRFHARAVELARPFADAKLDGYLTLCEGSAHWLERRYGRASELLSASAEILERAPDAAWERAAAYNFRSYARLMLGEYRRLRADLSRHVALAREHGDVHELVDLSTTFAQALLYSGDVAGTRRALDESQRGWDPEPYRISHLWILYAEVPLAIYRGEPDEAVRACEDAFVAMAKVFLDQARHVMRNGREIHGRSCIAAAARAKSPASLLARARKQARRIAGTGNPVLEAQSANIFAGIAALRGDEAEACRCWREAAAAFDAHGMRGYAAAIHYRLGTLLDDTEGRGHAARAQEFFLAEEVVEPARFADVFAPGPLRGAEPAGAPAERSLP